MRCLAIASVALVFPLAASGVLAAEVEPPATGTFGPAGTLADARMHHSATLLPDGRVLIIGGHAEGRAMAGAELWDPETASYSSTGPLAEARSWHTASLLPDGSVVVLGGFDRDPNDPLASAERWDPVTGAFASAGSLLEPRSMHTATVLPDGMVLIVGGSTYSDSGMMQPAATTELWDPVAGVTVTSRTGERYVGHNVGHTATLLPDGSVLFTQGFGAERWDPADGTISPAGSNIKGRLSATTSALLDGTILIAGGFEYPEVVASTELWDPATGVFEVAEPLIQARQAHTATVLPDGRVLVVGGGAYPEPLDSAELRDPVSGTFSPAAPLATARAWHTATLLPDGRVLVAGGGDVDGREGALASAELWAP